jgi:hypothetical protein
MSLSGRDFPDKRDLNSGSPGAKMTRKSYSWLPKSLGWIGNAVNSNHLCPAPFTFSENRNNNNNNNNNSQQQQSKMSDSEDSLLDSAYKKLVDSSSSTIGADLLVLIWRSAVISCSRRLRSRSASLNSISSAWHWKKRSSMLISRILRPCTKTRKRCTPCS